MNEPEVIVGIGGTAGDGVASASNTLAVSVARQGQAVFAYNSYQSVIRGGHSRAAHADLRAQTAQSWRSGPRADCANQDTLDRQELVAGGAALYHSAKLRPNYQPPAGV
jgi:2-oxoglutarate ferredoxin oxidoreductase subunit alpha